MLPLINKTLWENRQNRDRVETQDPESGLQTREQNSEVLKNLPDHCSKKTLFSLVMFIVIPDINDAVTLITIKLIFFSR